MTCDFRLDVVEALEDAGWTGVPDNPLGLLRHPSGATFGVLNESGDCGLDVPDGGVVDFPGGIPDGVVIAACLAASGQLKPAPDVVCDAEGHAVPHSAGCPER